MIFEHQSKLYVLETIKHWIEEKEEISELKITIEDYYKFGEFGESDLYTLTISEDANCTSDEVNNG